MTPTAQQLRASQHVRTSEKNLAVQAYAGTGKTTSIVDMVKCTSPREKVLALAFNKTNADDLRAKLPRRVDVKTLHGLAYGAVQRSRASKLEIDPSRQRWIIQKVVPESKTYKWSAVCSGVRKLTALAMNTLTLEFDALVELLWDYGVLPEKGVTPEQMAAWTMQVLELSRVPDSTISYDDMIFLAAVEGIVTGGYDVVFFDEAQDANLAQIIVLINSVRPGGKIVIVGDKHQCIYTWRGASARAFEELINRLQADVLPLSVTFRCPERVVELARCLVDEYEAAPGAPVGDVTWDTGAAFYKAVSPGHAVIGRSNWAIGHACLQLLRMGKKARVVGKDYGETLQTLVSRGDTNDIKALLEWIGPYVAEECLKHAAAGKEERGEQLTDACDLLKTLAEGVPNVARLRERIESLFDDTVPESAIRLSTVHRAKGLQWGVVWMLESSFNVDTEEGANLYYVAATRTLGWGAEGELHLVQTQKRDGSVPVSIARELLPASTIARWEAEDEVRYG